MYDGAMPPRLPDRLPLPFWADAERSRRDFDPRSIQDEGDRVHMVIHAVADDWKILHSTTRECA
jgi:hypothetical protein